MSSSFLPPLSSSSLLSRSKDADDEASLYSLDSAVEYDHDANENDNDDDEDDDDDELAEMFPSTHAAADEEAFEQASHHLPFRTVLTLTCTVGGLQVVWSTIMANLSPLLQHKGFSKSAAAWILVSQPLCGTFVGPLCGAITDKLRTRWGRRRPMLVGGAGLVAASLLILAFIDEIVRYLASCPLASCADEDNEARVRQVGRAGAVLGVLALAGAVQPVQAGIRSLLVDRAGAAQQAHVNAWASRMAGVGSIVGFCAGAIDLPHALHLVGQVSQFQALAVLASAVLGVTVGVTCVAIPEADNREFRNVAEERHIGGSGGAGKRAFRLRIWNSVGFLSQRVRQVCRTQLCSWFAWFAFLYYTTTYIAELGHTTAAGANSASNARRDSQDHGARAGTFASLCFALVALTCTIVLPWILPYVTRSTSMRRAANGSARSQAESKGRRVGAMASGGKSLASLWTISNALFGMLMLATGLITSQRGGTILVATAGISWAVTIWVPFAIIGEDIAEQRGRRDAADQSQNHAGVIMGIHNMAISLPQIIAGVVSGGIYWLAEASGSDAPTSWIFTASGCAALIAAISSGRIEDS